MSNKLNNIVKGWKNYIFPSSEIEILAAKRAITCASCSHAVEGRFEIIEDKRIEEIKGMGCDMCLCPLSTKLRSPEEECPINKW